MHKVRSVLFVCTGNSCRSIMAEGLLKKYLKDLGKTHITVNSAGIMPVGGLFPTDETVEVMKEEGIDVSGLRSKHATEELIKKADLILVMEEMHKAEIVRRMPDAASKTFLLKEYANEGKISHPRLGVPDPIGKPLAHYRVCRDMIKKEIERIAQLL